MTQANSASLRGRVALVTGANTGIGLVTARELATRGAHVFVACRSHERALAALASIASPDGTPPPEALVLDLGDFDSVQRCATAFLARDLPLHILVNNGGIAGARGLSASGFELAFGVNHMGHFLLTRLLLQRIQASAPARIVTVASKAHRRVGGIDWGALRQRTATRSGFPEYAVSKLANVLFSAELGRRLAGSGVTTHALHPGVVASDIWRQVPWPLRALMKLTMTSTEDGARTTLHCATSPEVAHDSGLYYDDCRVAPPSPLGQDRALAAELWVRSEDWVQQASLR